MLVIDTKYKRLEPGQRQLGIAEDDVYQMLAYFIRLSCPCVLLLYPSSANQPPLRARFEIANHPGQLLAATLNLNQPLETHGPLSQELRDILAWASV